MTYKDIIIVEGFDMVGKTKFAKQEFSEYSHYYANHDLTDITVGRNNSWTIGYGIIDFLSQVHKSGQKILINRGICSSIVYESIYNKTDLNRSIVDYYRNNQFFHDNIDIVYVRHNTRTCAEYIYEMSKSRERNKNELSDQYDKFKDFNDYWNTYRLFDHKFHESFSMINFDPIVVLTKAGCWEILGRDGSDSEIRTLC